MVFGESESIIFFINVLKIASFPNVGESIFKLKFSFKYSLLYGLVIFAIPVFKAVNPSSFEASLKKYFFSISCAIIGSKTLAVLPVPVPPQTKRERYLQASPNVTF